MRDIAEIILKGTKYYDSYQVSYFHGKLYENGFISDGDAVWRIDMPVKGYKLIGVIRLDKDTELWEQQVGKESRYWASLTIMDEQKIPLQLEEMALMWFKRVLSKLGLELVKETKTTI